MSDAVQKLIDRRANLVAQMRELAERAVDESRDMSAEEDRQFTEMNAEVDALQNRADAMLAGEKRAKEIEDSFAVLSGKPQERQTPDQAKGEEEVRAFLRGEGGRFFDVPVERRDVLKSGSGGNTVPESLDGRLWEYLIEESSILGAGVTVLRTSGGEVMNIPKATVHSTAAATNEGATITESDPTFAQTALSVAKDSYLVQVSREMVDDTGVDLLGYIARSAGRELGNKVGSNAVAVLIAGTAPGVTGGVGVTSPASFDDVIDLFYSVIAPYRNRSSAGWLVSDLAAADLRKLKDGNGQYVWLPSTTAGANDMILGKPVYVDPAVPDPAAAAESIVFGDLSSLYVRIAGGFRFERSDDYAFGSDLVTFRAIVRHGAAHVDPNATTSFLGA